MNIAYLHGFASSPAASKAVYLEKVLSQHGLGLVCPDLNRPSFSKLSYAAMLEELDQALAGKDDWRLVGSSLGGWLAARWAELHPERVESLVLLCPAFRMRERWPGLVGPKNFERWSQEGWLPFPDANGVPAPVHFGLMTEAETQPSTPDVPCRTLIIHGTKDETVPIALSREYAAARTDRVRLLEIDDDHRMLSSSDLISREVLRFFEIA